MKPKLTFHKTVVTVFDETTKNKYEVVFSGKHGSLSVVIFENGNRVDSFYKEMQHGNKTVAMWAINRYLKNK